MSPRAAEILYTTSSYFEPPLNVMLVMAMETETRQVKIVLKMLAVMVIVMANGYANADGDNCTHDRGHNGLNSVGGCFPWSCRPRVMRANIQTEMPRNMIEP